MAGKQGQARANSGVFLQGRYEVQILDTYGYPPETSGAGAIYEAGKVAELCRRDALMALDIGRHTAAGARKVRRDGYSGGISGGAGSR